MRYFSTLLDLTCGKPLGDEDAGRARRLQIAVMALLTSIVFAALWGVAVGSRVPALAIANLYKVPMVVLLSAVGALPAGLLTWKLMGAPGRASDLLLAFVGGTFAATLVLAVLSPLVALYYHSSLWAGPMLGQGSALFALAVGVLIFARASFGRRGEGVRRAALAVPVSVLALVQVAMLIQLVAVAAPILPERTVFSHGVDNLAEVAR
ncbi:Hypothetical protein A7982_10407 [Minicystis rosea]|nr:Hypothetical protein A7982_10407 [Minicystis rosea]